MTLPDQALAHLRQMLGSPDVAGERYTLHEPVGQGGMGTVYRASDRALGRDVAVKVLRGDVADAEAAARLEREARILARLEHPGIVPVHDVGMLADGRVFYVMKLVRGRQLQEFVRGAARSDVLRVVLRVCETVGFAHAHGVVHRDLKPANIMVGAFGEVLVLDWGIARVVGVGRTAESGTREAASGSVGAPGTRTGHAPPDPLPALRASPEPVTAPGTVLGTPGFMAPEQAQGEPGLVDARADVYGLGAILRSVLADHGDRRGVPRPLQAIWTRALSPDPAARYPSAADLAADITRFLDAQPVTAYREPFAERVGRIFRKYQTAIILVLTYLAVRLLFLLLRGV
ncbi:MAG TPA: serine/threonine-protein kinase [Gemmatimonadales bacterium]|nr:serine/threonine-protein kinase [Gemmatimonadales bacterium]